MSNIVGKNIEKYRISNGVYMKFGVFRENMLPDFESLIKIYKGRITCASYSTLI